MYQGSCLCGRVTYQLDGQFDHFFLCHCKYCQKDTGSAHAANLFSERGTLSWLNGEHLVTRFDLPATRHSKSFCTLCGSALPYRLPNEGGLVIPAGSVDGDVPILPKAHLFESSKANWDSQLEIIPGFATFPE